MTDLTPLRAFLAKLLSTHGDTAPFTDQDSLTVSGRLDSVDMMEIVFFLEDKYGADFTQRDVKLEEFDSVESIRRLLG
jgi:acyl carrier protein